MKKNAYQVGNTIPTQDNAQDQILVNILKGVPVKEMVTCVTLLKHSSF